MAARVPPFEVVAASGRSSVIGLAAGGAVGVDVLQGDQQRVGVLGGGQHAPLQRREQGRPGGVGGVQTLVDDGRPFGGVGGGFGIGGIRGPPVDTIDQGVRPVARHRPYRDALRGQAGGEGEADLPGAEYHVHRAVTHRFGSPGRIAGSWPYGRSWP